MASRFITAARMLRKSSVESSMKTISGTANCASGITYGLLEKTGCVGKKDGRDMGWLLCVCGGCTCYNLPIP